MHIPDLANAENLSDFDNKQRINLSDHAFSTLENDEDIFEPERKKESQGISSTVINRVFACFKEKAEASIEASIVRKQEEYRDTLEECSEGDTKQKILSLLLDAYRKQLESNVLSRPDSGSHPFQVRVNRENMAFFASSEGQSESAFYNDRVGKYMKAVLEEYARLSYVEREAVYFQELRLKVDTAIIHSTQLKLTLRKSNNARKPVLYIKPIGVRRDYANQYNYIVGLTSQDGDEWQAGSVRLTSIADCSLLLRSGFISAADRAMLDEEVRRCGVQYLSSSTASERVVVRFTAYGEQMYGSMLHQRPMYVEKTDSRVYTFDCTLRQAENYFFKFGHNVRILEPDSLAVKFRDRYKNAYEQYLS